MEKIVKEMTIRQVLDICPKAESVLAAHLGNCVSCPGAQIETLALGAHLHKKDVNELVEELNGFCQKQEK